jgi:hypothetical protein
VASTCVILTWRFRTAAPRRACRRAHRYGRQYPIDRVWARMFRSQLSANRDRPNELDAGLWRCGITAAATSGAESVSGPGMVAAAELTAPTVRVGIEPTLSDEDKPPCRRLPEALSSCAVPTVTHASRSGTVSLDCNKPVSQDQAVSANISPARPASESGCSCASSRARLPVRAARGPPRRLLSARTEVSAYPRQTRYRSPTVASRLWLRLQAR